MRVSACLQQTGASSNAVATLKLQFRYCSGGGPNGVVAKATALSPSDVVTNKVSVESNDSAVRVELGPHAAVVPQKWDDAISAQTARDTRFSRTPTGNVLADNTRALQTEVLEEYTPRQRPIYSPETGKKTFTRDASRGYRSVDGGRLLVSEQFLAHTGEGATPDAELTAGGPSAVTEFVEENRAFPPKPPHHVGRQRRQSYTEAEVGPFAPGGRLYQPNRDDIHKTTVASKWDDPDAGKDEQMIRVIKARRDVENLSPTGQARKAREEEARERALFEQDPEEYYKRFYNDKHRVLDREGNVVRGDSSLLGFGEGRRREQRHFQLPVKGDGAIPEDPVLIKNPDPHAQDDFVYGRQYPSLPGRAPRPPPSSIEGRPPADSLPPPTPNAKADMLRALRGGGEPDTPPPFGSGKSRFEELLSHKHTAGDGAANHTATTAPKEKVINEAQLQRDLRELSFWKDANGYEERLAAFQAKYPTHDPETGAPLTRKGLYSEAEIAAGLEGQPLDLRRASPALQAQFASNPVANFHPSILANDLLSQKTNKPGGGLTYESPQAKELRDLEAEMARHMALRQRASVEGDLAPRTEPEQRGIVERVTGLDPVQQKQVRLCMSDFDLKDGMATLHVMHTYPHVDGLTCIIAISIGATLLYLQDRMHLIDYYEEVIGLDTRTFPRAKRYVYMAATCVTLAVLMHPITVGSIFATRVYRIAMRRPIGPP